MKIFLRKWTGLTQKSYKKHVREENEKTIVKSVSEAVRDTIIENTNTRKRD